MKSKINLPGFTAAMSIETNRWVYNRIPGMVQTKLSLSKLISPQLINTGGPGGGLGFSCGDTDTPNFCSCDGSIDSPDCQSMRKNCTGPVSCGWLADGCTCPYNPTPNTTPVSKIPILSIRSPVTNLF